MKLNRNSPSSLSSSVLYALCPPANVWKFRTHSISIESVKLHYNCRWIRFARVVKRRTYAQYTQTNRTISFRLKPNERQQNNSLRYRYNQIQSHFDRPSFGIHTYISVYLFSMINNKMKEMKNRYPTQQQDQNFLIWRKTQIFNNTRNKSWA